MCFRLLCSVQYFKNVLFFENSLLPKDKNFSQVSKPFHIFQTRQATGNNQKYHMIFADFGQKAIVTW